jgi:hypothetical protein
VPERLSEVSHIRAMPLVKSIGRNCSGWLDGNALATGRCSRVWAARRPRSEHRCDCSGPHHELGALQHLSWVVTSFIVASTVSAPLYGKLSDLYGRKPAFIASISIFLAGSTLCGFAASMGGLIRSARCRAWVPVA